MTVLELEQFAVEHGGVVWSISSICGRLEFRFQDDAPAVPALLDALAEAFGAAWPIGRVAVFDAPAHPEQGHVRGTIDPGDGSAAALVVTMFARELDVWPRRVEV